MGLNTDLAPWDLGEESLTYVNNVRLTNNSLVSFGGYSTIETLPVDFQPGFLMHVGSTSSPFWIIPGRDSVLIYDSFALTDISSVAGYASINNEDLWTGCNLSTVPIITNRATHPEFWPQLSVAAQMLPLPWDATRTWAEANQACGIIRAHKQFLFALDITIAGVESPNGVRWSSPADVGDIPDSWDELDITNVAGLTFLRSNGGKIIDGLSLRDAFVVYRESSISVFDFVGGQFVWQIRELDGSVGLTSPECIVEINGKHYFIGNGDIMVNDGNTVQSLLHNKFRKRFVNNFDADSFLTSYIVHNNITSEIWFCVPETGNAYPNVAYIHNYRDGSWTLRDIPLAVSASYGSRQSSSVFWNTLATTWDTEEGGWSSSTTSPLANSIISVIKPLNAGLSGSLVLPDLRQAPSEIDYTASIERIGFPLGGLDSTTTIQRIYPHMRGTGTVNIQIGSQDDPGGLVTWKPAVRFQPAFDRKVDIRSTGNLHCFRLTADFSEGIWELSGLDIEYVSAGNR